MSLCVLSKNSVAMTSADEVKKFCAPLFNLLDLNYFNYTRVYTSGKRFSLCTHAHITEKYYKNKWYECSPFERNPEFYYDGCFLWSQSSDNSLNSFKSYLKEYYKINDMLSIVKTRKEYMDIYSFATDSEKVDLRERCFKIISILERFIHYFCIEAAPLVKKASEEKFYVPFESDKLSKHDPSGLEIDEKIKDFYEKTVFSQLSIPSQSGEMILISKRETDCLVNLVKGKTAKKIAKILNISYRTVETHLANIKNKTGYNSIDELVEAALNAEGLTYFL